MKIPFIKNDISKEKMANLLWKNWDLILEDNIKWKPSVCYTFDKKVRNLNK